MQGGVQMIFKTRFSLWFIIFINIFIYIVPQTAFAKFGYNFGYGDVYYLDEATDQWLHDGFSEYGLSNNSVSYSLTGRIKTEFGDQSTNALAAADLDKSDIPITNFFIYRNGPFSIQVTALPFNNPQMVDMSWDSIQNHFILAYTRTVAKWEFVYRVTNTTNRIMYVEEIKDNFGAELEIESWSYTITNREANQPLGDYVPNSKGNEGFVWKNFYLKPGQTGEITFIVATRKNPAGKQHYGECGVYHLNSNGTLKYWLDGEKDKISIDGYRFLVRVCDQLSFSVLVELSTTNIVWLIRKPGDYFVKAIDGVVKVNGNWLVNVAVTFSDFDNLIADDAQQIPVFYSLGDQTIPGDWISPLVLNNTDVNLQVSARQHGQFSIWQRIVVDNQSAGRYENTGVITFTLVNSRPFYD